MLFVDEYVKRQFYFGLVAFVIALLPVCVFVGSMLVQSAVYKEGLIPLVGVYAILSAWITIPLSIIFAIVSLKRRERGYVRWFAYGTFVINILPLWALLGLVLFMLH